MFSFNSLPDIIFQVRTHNFQNNAFFYVALVSVIFMVRLVKVESENFLQSSPNLGGLFRVSFEVGGAGKITPCLKLVRIMLET